LTVDSPLDLNIQSNGAIKLQSWKYEDRFTVVKNAKNTLPLWDIIVNIQNYRQMYSRQLAIEEPPTNVIWNDFPSINVRSTINQEEEI
jgi:hypothetical protein